MLLIRECSRNTSRPPIEIIYVLIRARNINRLFHNSQKGLSFLLIRSLKKFIQASVRIRKKKLALSRLRIIRGAL